MPVSCFVTLRIGELEVVSRRLDAAVASMMMGCMGRLVRNCGVMMVSVIVRV